MGFYEEPVENSAALLAESESPPQTLAGKPLNTRKTLFPWQQQSHGIAPRSLMYEEESRYRLECSEEGARDAGNQSTDYRDSDQKSVQEK